MLVLRELRELWSDSIPARAIRRSPVGAAIVAVMVLAFGGLLLIGNVGFLGDTFSTSGFLRRFWPLLIFGYGLWHLASDGFRPSWRTSLMLAFAAAISLMNFGWFRPNPRLLIPLAIIGFGGLMLWTIRRAYRNGGPETGKGTVIDPYPNAGPDDMAQSWEPETAAD